MNIVFAFADDWGRYASIYKNFEGENSINSIINTPNIDRIGREGMIFKNAIVPAPSCTPCRSALCSGKYFWQTGRGAILRGAIWDTSIPTYPLELEKAGYYIGFSYKVWSPGENPDAPYGGERNAYMSAGTRFNSFSQNVTKLAEKMSVEEAKEEMYSEVRSNFKEFLAGRESDKPFCYWWGPQNTHRMWEQGSGKALWGIEPDSLKGKLPECLPDVDEVREDFADYLGEAMAFDGGVGVLIKELEEIGELDNTLFVVSGDHGIPGMPHGKCNLYNLGAEVALLARYPFKIAKGLVIDDFVNLMELAPTFLDMAGVDIPSSMTAKSLMPILTCGKSGQIEAERNFTVTGRERHVDIARDYYLPYPQRAIHTKDYLYIINFAPSRWPMGAPLGLEDPNYVIDYNLLKTDTYAAFPDMDASPTKAWIIYHRNEEDYKNYYDIMVGKRPYEELYDLRQDKDAVNNVAADSKYSKIKSELNFKLLTLLKEQNDPRVTEEDCCFEKYPYTMVTQDPERTKVKLPNK